MSYQPHGQQFGHVDPDERLDYAETEPPEEEYEPRRRLPMIALAAGAAALFIGGLWFAYHEGAKHAGVSVASGSSGNAADNVPLIRADPEPVKVKPDKAGGMSIPDKDDPLYTMGRGGNAEHILPPPEAPQPRPVAPPPPPPQPTAHMPVSVPPAGAYPPPLPAPPPVSVQAKPAPKPAEAAKPAKPAKPAEPAAGGPPVKVQLASLRTPDEAREEWQRLKHENADLLGRLTAVAVKADLGERGIWYRVEAGPVGDRAAAIKLCRALKERDLGCQLVQ